LQKAFDVALHQYSSPANQLARLTRRFALRFAVAFRAGTGFDQSSRMARNCRKTRSFSFNSYVSSCSSFFTSFLEGGSVNFQA
jgi:hypothetical protein